MARRVPIRMKLAGALFLPLAALTLVTGAQVLTTMHEVQDVHEQANLARSSLGMPGLVTQVEYERDAASMYLIGQEATVNLPVEDNAEARANTDEALEAFRAEVADQGGDVARAYGPSLEAMANLEDLRAQVDSYTDARTLANTPFATENFNGYTELMDQLYTANHQVTLSMRQPDLRRGAELADLAAHQTDLIARLVRDLLLPTVSGDADGINQPEEIAAVARRLADLRANEMRIKSTAEGSYEQYADRLLATDHIVRFPQVTEEALDTARVDVAEMLASSTGPDADAFGYTVFRRSVDAQLQAEADDVIAAADARLRRYALLATLAVAIAVGVAWMVSRSITRPLRTLTEQAKAMAGHRLPGAVRHILETPLGEDVDVPELEPVRVRTNDEVDEVVKALNTVQYTALDLAAEQAVLRRNIADSFVNLGRRNQNLLSRQLDFITELESNETDPDTLASLFRLDHLATRMRRNAESLLLLAGVDPPRKWAAPVRLTDVIRAALGEVEDYQRVTVREAEVSTILGSAAADLAHLLAEFVENALTFSPPDKDVEVHGRHMGDGYTLAVVDAGFGMSAEDMDVANRRLAGVESYTIAPSKYLGHYVAGNLAARHDIDVQLSPTPGGGVTATVHLPPTLLTDGSRPPADAAAAASPPAAAAGGRPMGPSSNGTGEPPEMPAEHYPLEPVGADGYPAGREPAYPANPYPPTQPVSADAYLAEPEPAYPADPYPATQPVPADPYLAEPLPPEPGPLTAPPAPAPVATRPQRTASGLVKRTRRHGPPTNRTNGPNDALLADLAMGPASLRAGFGATTPPAPAPAPAPAPPLAPAEPGPANGTTPHGLARRVRGQHMPATGVRTIRREPAQPAAAPRSSPDDVYGFLSDFTAGVQRGLDDVGRIPGPNGNGHNGSGHTNGNGNGHNGNGHDRH